MKSTFSPNITIERIHKINLALSMIIVVQHNIKTKNQLNFNTRKFLRGYLKKQKRVICKMTSILEIRHDFGLLFG